MERIDFEDYEICFYYFKGDPGCYYMSNGDPGYPPEPPEYEIVKVLKDGVELSEKDWPDYDDMVEYLDSYFEYSEPEMDDFYD